MDVWWIVCRALCAGVFGASLAPLSVAQEQAPAADYVPPVLAQDVTQSNPAFDTVPPSLISWIQEGTREADYVTGLLRYAQDYDLDGDGLDKGDIDLHTQVAIARVRAESLSRLMSNDLDGD